MKAAGTGGLPATFMHWLLEYRTRTNWFNSRFPVCPGIYREFFERRDRLGQNSVSGPFRFRRLARISLSIGTGKCEPDLETRTGNRNVSTGKTKRAVWRLQSRPS